MDSINYHVEVTPDGQWVHITARHVDGTEAGQPRGSFGLQYVRDEVFTRADKVTLEAEVVSRQEIEQFGEKLFRALFYDPAVGEHFRNTFRQARERRQLLRVELDFDETQMPEIAALPWELLRAPQTSGYPSITLATDPNLALSRRRSLWEPPPCTAKVGPLNILLAIAAPDEPELGPVAYEEVLEELQTLTQQPETRFKLLGDPVLDANLERLDEALYDKPDILHFIGHGRFISDIVDLHGELAMVDMGGWADWCRDDLFSDLLDRHVPVIVFLQACEGGALGSARGLTGVASKIVQRNVPVVVAMQYPISNAAALVFARRFYQRLAMGDPVDKATQEGRRALWFKYPYQLEFAAPVLFMRSSDGRVFDIEQTILSSSEQISEGLVALTELMRAREVQDAVFTFRADFQVACKQIRAMGHLKQLHDLFQELENLYNIIDDERRRQPTGQGVWETLMLHEPELQGVIDSILDVTSYADSVADNAWWTQLLGQARRNLRVAVESFDLGQFDRATRCLDRILGREPSRINTRLVVAARSLRLTGLVKAMDTLRNSLAHPELEWEAVQRFTDSVDALAELDSRLDVLVGEHDRWQEVDDELHRVEDNLDQDLGELELAWPDLNAMTCALCDDRTADWATALAEVCAKLGHALTTQDPVRTRMFFFRYRSQAGRRLRKVDSDLLTLCRDFQRIGQSLDLLMRTM